METVHRALTSAHRAPESAWKKLYRMGLTERPFSGILSPQFHRALRMCQYGNSEPETLSKNDRRAFGSVFCFGQGGGVMWYQIHLFIAAWKMRRAAYQLDLVTHGKPIDLDEIPEGQAFIKAYKHYLALRRAA